MKPFRSGTALLLSLFCGITCIFSSSISGQDLPTLVQTAHFSAVQKPKATVSLAQSELSLNALLFFDRGTLQYREKFHDAPVCYMGAGAGKKNGNGDAVERVLTGRLL